MIGGAACDIILEESDESFRVTKDLDLVLIVEALTPEFGKAFWQFIVNGRFGDKAVNLPPEVHNDMEQFISMYEKAPADLKSLHIVGVTNEQIVERLREIYLQMK